ncbi:MAG TPA: aminopeptidase P family N-terminal domain-containing protein [Thermoleophilia bacterium]|nr:aminopeptidase P family N-terminal domain-containing protein [Thermoleophilia bacterium]
MAGFAYEKRVARCGELIRAQELDVLLLAKPSNMFYLTGDGRLCAYAMLTQEGKVALGVLSTDVADVSVLARFDRIAGFEDEVGMLHAIAHDFREFGLESGVVGLEYSFLTQSMLRMLTHPHAKPAGMEPKDATPVLSQLRLVKEPEEIARMREAGRVWPASAWLPPSRRPGSTPCAWPAPRSSGAPMYPGVRAPTSPTDSPPVGR